jgi:hypothetical protein
MNNSTNTSKWDAESTAFVALTSISCILFLIEFALLVAVFIGQRAYRLFWCYQLPRYLPPSEHRYAKLLLHVTLLFVLVYVLYKVALFASLTGTAAAQVSQQAASDALTMLLCFSASLYDILFSLLLLMWIRICSVSLDSLKIKAWVLTAKVIIGILDTISIVNVIYVLIVWLGFAPYRFIMGYTAVPVFLFVKVSFGALFLVVGCRIMYLLHRSSETVQQSPAERALMIKMTVGIIIVFVSCASMLLSAIVGFYVYIWIVLIAIILPEAALFLVMIILFWPKEFVLVRKKQQKAEVDKPI